MSTNISYMPTDGLSYDPSEAKYWDREALDKELVRVFEVCHGCRMCFKYCGSFPDLFKAIDDKCDGDVRKLTAGDIDRVMDGCFQCKLCEVQCPYTPADQHEFQLDFPKLVHRYVAQRQRAKGSTFRDKVLGNPDGAAKLARASFGLANVMNRVGAHRFFMEKVLGVHREKLLPEFAQKTFEKSVHSSRGLAQDTGHETVLFQTCYVQNNEPQIGHDTLAVMEVNQVDCAVVKGLVCCGMPKWEKGDLAGLRAQAKQNLDVLEPHVDAGSKVLGLNPTCTMMLRKEYPELVDEADRARARKVAAAVMEASEFLWSIRKEERFCDEPKSKPDAEGFSYHAPCHLRAQRVGFKGRDLLKKVLGIRPATVMECCGHDGTYAMTVEGFEASQKVGKKAFNGMKEGESAVWSTDCPLAAIQFEQHAGVKALHPMTILARAYREGGFEQNLVAIDEPTQKPTIP
ncbi:MAG: heterodisulfide reductase-related iron-sulfur binding cluster [Myxococcota bacterium]|nr:heterodisulfide reductase-related iron-sulfur binding cluster [Myxococcota bacterium]